MRVVCCQTDIAWEDKAENFRRIGALLDTVAIPSGALIVLPEMCGVGFGLDVAKIAESDDRPTETFFAQLAQRYQGCLLGGVVHQTAQGRGLNQAVAVAYSQKIGAAACREAVSQIGEEVSVGDSVGDSGGGAVGVLCRYTKLHPFTHGEEAAYYDRGRDVVTFDWEGWTVAPAICYDLRFPELFRLAVGQGAQLLVVIANFPAKRDYHWRSLLIARAIENQCYVVGVNRTGDDPKVRYLGHSLVIDPMGHVLADAGSQPGVIQVDLNLQSLQAYREQFPALADRWLGNDREM